MNTKDELLSQQKNQSKGIALHGPGRGLVNVRDESRSREEHVLLFCLEGTRHGPSQPFYYAPVVVKVIRAEHRPTLNTRDEKTKWLNVVTLLK